MSQPNISWSLAGWWINQNISATAIALGSAAVAVPYFLYRRFQRRKHERSFENSRIRSGLNVVITGGSKGVGYALAKEFIRRGHNVLICSRNADRVKWAVTQLTEYAKSLFESTQSRRLSTVIGRECDVTNAASLDELTSCAKQHFPADGVIDIWINNAARNGGNIASLSETDPEEISGIVSANLTGTLLGCRAALRIMHNQQYGAIFNMDGRGSNGSASPGTCVYGATKCAIPQVTATLVAEERQRAANISNPTQPKQKSRVGIFTISPGMVLTDLLLRGNSQSSYVRTVFDILAEEADTVANWLVPRVIDCFQSGGDWSGRYVRFLTPLGAAGRFLTFFRYRHRFFDENGQLKVKYIGDQQQSLAKAFA